MLPHATLTDDLFHVVQLAVKAVGDVRRRVVRTHYGRRGRSSDPEYGIKGLLVRNLEHLSPAQFGKIMDTLGGNRYGQEIAAAWIAKEKTARRAEPEGTHHRLRPVRAPGAGPPVHLLRLMRPARRHPRAGHPRRYGIPVGKRDYRGGHHRDHERHQRKHEPPRKTRGKARVRVQEPLEPAPARPHRLHPRVPSPLTLRNSPADAYGNRTAARSQLTYFDLKSPKGDLGAAVRAAFSGPAGGSAGKSADLDQVVGEYPVSAPDGGSLAAVQPGAVPAVSALEVADPAFAAGSPLDQGSEAAGMLDASAGG